MMLWEGERDFPLLLLLLLLLLSTYHERTARHLSRSHTMVSELLILEATVAGARPPRRPANNRLLALSPPSPASAIRIPRASQIFPALTALPTFCRGCTTRKQTPPPGKVNSSLAQSANSIAAGAPLDRRSPRANTSRRCASRFILSATAAAERAKEELRRTQTRSRVLSWGLELVVAFSVSAPTHPPPPPPPSPFPSPPRQEQRLVQVPP